MIVLARPLLKQVVDAAEAAYPDECCGLLVGHTDAAGMITVRRIVASANIAESGRTRDRFEIDPQVRFDLMRALRDREDDIVGHYHSHPDHAAEPSAYDLKMAWEPDLVWLITAVFDGQAIHTTAHMPDTSVDTGGTGFRPLCLRTTEGGKESREEGGEK